MKEEDVYNELGQWLQNKKNLEWHKTTHLNRFIMYSEDDDMLEPDICLGKIKGQNYELTDVIHVKTKDNLKSSGQRFELVGKANFSIKGVKKTWIAIDESSFWIVKTGLHNEVGIMTYKEKNSYPRDFQIKKDAIEIEKPKFFKETQRLFNEKFGQEIKASQRFFITSMDKENWPICKNYRLWGVPENGPGESVIKQAKPSDLILVRLNKGRTKPYGKFGFVAIWMVVSEPFSDPNGGPWKNNNTKERRNFNWQVKIFPILVDEFETPIDLHYVNGVDDETKIASRAYKPGMLKISETVYKILSKRLVEKNLSQLQI